MDWTYWITGYLIVGAIYMFWTMHINLKLADITSTNILIILSSVFTWPMWFVGKRLPKFTILKRYHPQADSMKVLASVLKVNPKVRVEIAWQKGLVVFMTYSKDEDEILIERTGNVDWIQMLRELIEKVPETWIYTGKLELPSKMGEWKTMQGKTIFGEVGLDPKEADQTKPETVDNKSEAVPWYLLSTTEYGPTGKGTFENPLPIEKWITEEEARKLEAIQKETKISINKVLSSETNDKETAQAKPPVKQPLSPHRRPPLPMADMITPPVSPTPDPPEIADADLKDKSLSDVTFTPSTKKGPYDDVKYNDIKKEIMADTDAIPPPAASPQIVDITIKEPQDGTPGEVNESFKINVTDTKPK